MARKTKEERKAALKKRTQSTVKNRDVSKYGGIDVLDLAKSGKKGKVNMYECLMEKKKNMIDILPFEITQDWYKTLKTFNGKLVGLEPGDEEYKLEYAMHRNVGSENKSMLCLKQMFGLPCEACSQRDEEFKKDNPDEDITDGLKPTWRCIYNIYDYNEPEKDIQVWDYSRYLFEATLLEDAENDDGGIILFADIEEGKTLQFKGKKKTMGKQSFAEVAEVTFVDRDAYQDGILDDTYPLDKMLVIPTVEEFTKAFLGLEEGDEPGGSDDPGDSEKETPRQSRRRSPKEEKTDDNKCPNGHVFGVNCNEKPECENCDENIFNECADLQDKINAGEQTSEPETPQEPEPKKPTRRTRRSAPPAEEKETEKPTTRTRRRR